MTHQQVKADQYRAFAADASAVADASTLSEVRGKHETAAARWNELARLTERQTTRAEA